MHWGTGDAMRPTSFDGFDGANDGVSAMLAQINRSKEQFVSSNFPEACDNVVQGARWHCSHQCQKEV